MTPENIERIMRDFARLQHTDDWKIVTTLMTMDPADVRSALERESDNQEAANAVSGELGTAIDKARGLVRQLKPFHEALQGESFEATHRRAGIRWCFRDRREELDAR